MRWGALVLWCVAACNSDVGIDLQVIVPPDVDVTHVEVFMANEHCFTDDGTFRMCQDGVSWAPDVRPPGYVYYMNGDTQRVTVTDERRGDRFVMQLQATPEYKDTILMSVVGYDANDRAVAVATLLGASIPLNSSRRWIVELSPADMARPGVTSPPGMGEPVHRVHSWQRLSETSPDALSRCLAVQAWNEYAGAWDGYFIVPKDDPDCDGIYPPAAVECDPLAANFQGGACLVPDAATGVCSVGTTTCWDGRNDDRTCRSNPDDLICVPTGLCEACSALFGVPTCVVREMITSKIGHLDCQLTPDIATSAPCVGNNVPTRVEAIVPANCRGLRVARLPDDRLQLMTTQGIAFVPLPLGQADLSIGFTQLGPKSCKLAIYWERGTLAPQHAWYVIGIENGVSTIAIPLRLEINPGEVCPTEPPTTPPSCEARDGLLEDLVFSCPGADGQP